MLLQCTRHDLRVTKIECYTSLNPSGFVIIFKQFRTRAKNGVKKNLYKLMNNAIFYGKRSNSLRYKINNKMGWALWCEGNDRKNRISTTVAEKLIAVKLHKLEVKFNKPIHVGMCIFDISKVCLLVWISSRLYVTDDESRQMQNYVHRYSFIYRVECDNIYETMKHDVARFDTSDPI